MPAAVKRAVKGDAPGRGGCRDVPTADVLVPDDAFHHGLPKDLPAGQARVQVDVRREDEVPVEQVRVRADADELLGRGDLVRIVRLARPAGELDGRGERGEDSNAQKRVETDDLCDSE